MLNFTDTVGYNRTTTNSTSGMLSSAGTIVISFAVTVLVVVSGIGNILVIVAFKRNRHLRNLSNYFLVSLAVADTIICVASIPLFSMLVITGYWPFGTVLCDVWLCLDYTCNYASLAHVLIICYDRYLGIFRPMAYKTRRSPKKVCITIAIAWVVAFLLWSPFIINWQYIEGQRTVPATECWVQFLFSNPSSFIVTSILEFYIPVLIMIVLYVSIYRKILLREKHLANLQSKKRTSSNKNSEHNENITFKQQVRNRCCNGVAISMCCNRVVDVGDDIPNIANVQGCFVEIATVHQSENSMTSEANNVIRMSAIDEIITKAIINKRSHTADVDDQINGLDNVHPHSNREQNRDRKAAKVLSAILISLLVTWLPYNVLAVLHPFCSTCIHDTAWDIVWGLCYINSIVNPLLYALCSVDFRRAYINILTGRCRQIQ